MATAPPRRTCNTDEDLGYTLYHMRAFVGLWVRPQPYFSMQKRIQVPRHARFHRQNAECELFFLNEPVKRFVDFSAFLFKTLLIVSS